MNVYYTKRLNRLKKSDDRENAGAMREFVDQSMFYGKESELTTVKPDAVHLGTTFVTLFVLFYSSNRIE